MLFVIDLKTRRVQIASISAQPCGKVLEQVARNLTDPFDGFLQEHRYLIHDRDPLFTTNFASILFDAGVARSSSRFTVHLQWGRRVNAAEVHHARVLSPAHSHLQWGRRVNAADVRARGISSAAATCFNGAAA